MFLRPLALWCAVAGITAAVGRPRPESKNLVIVTIDTVRSDRLGCYGYFRDTSPALDALAAESLRFTRCLTPIAQTTPSHWSLFTGVGPYEHDVLTNHTKPLKRAAQPSGPEAGQALRKLAESLRARGMKTGGFVGATPVKRHTGLDAGFEAWSEPDSGRRAGAEVVADALQFVASCGDQPFFLWVHLFDAHEPLHPPNTPLEYYQRYATDPTLEAWLAERGFPATTTELDEHDLSVVEANNHYDGALRYLDDQLAVLLKRLGAADLKETTALVVVADHGTAVGQHSHMGHGICWDEQLRVPLFMRVPGVAPRVVDTAMSTLDLWPTLFGLAPELAVPDFLQQVRGSDVLLDGYSARPLFAAAAKQGFEALTAGRWKLLRAPKAPPELYDLESDPSELVNVAAGHAEVVARLTKLLAAEVTRQKQSRTLHRKGAAAGGELDPKIVEELRALGYPAAGDEPPAQDGDHR